MNAVIAQKDITTNPARMLSNQYNDKLNIDYHLLSWNRCLFCLGKHLYTQSSPLLPIGDDDQEHVLLQRTCKNWCTRVMIPYVTGTNPLSRMHIVKCMGQTEEGVLVFFCSRSHILFASHFLHVISDECDAITVVFLLKVIIYNHLHCLVAKQGELLLSLLLLRC